MLLLDIAMIIAMSCILAFMLDMAIDSIFKVSLIDKLPLWIRKPVVILFITSCILLISWGLMSMVILTINSIS